MLTWRCALAPQLSARLAALEARAAARASAQADGALMLCSCRHPSAHTTHSPAERESDAAGDGEEEAREAWTLRVGTAVLKALDLAPSLATEAQLLAMRAAGPARARMPPPERPALAAGVAAAAMALARQPERQRLQAGVFRPSHILPTMTIEEFGA